MGWLSDLKDKFVDDIIPNEFKSGEKMKKTIRNLIPNELADVAVKAAPFVAPFSPEAAAAMRGIGRFDQRGSLSDAAKQAAATYGFGKAANYGLSKIPTGGKTMGDVNIFDEVALTGEKSSPNKIVENVKKVKDVFSGSGSGKKSEGKDQEKGVGGFREYFLGPDGEFQFSDIYDFITDEKKMIPAGMIGTYIKEKFFPGEKEPTESEKYLANRKADVENYLRLYGPKNFRRDVPNDPYSKAEIDQFVIDNTPEYRDKVASGGIMSVPRENYFLGGGKTFARAVNPNPDFERASTVTAEDIMDVFRKKGPFANNKGGGILSRFKKAKPATALMNLSAEMMEEDSPRGNIEDIMRVVSKRKPTMLSGGLRNALMKAFKDYNFDKEREEARYGGRMEYSSGSDIFDLYEKKLLEKEGYDYDSPEKYGSDRDMGILTLRDIIDVLSRSDYSRGGDTAQENAMQAATVEGLDLNVNPKGIMELDMREEGGFIPPVGVKEKADDIPAMLSNNEFVFTADAVRAAGGGSVDKGAQKMYKMMKDLEAQV